MSVIIPLLFLALFSYMAWILRQYIQQTYQYRDARRTEIKRRLQVEAKADAYWKEQIAGAEDTKQRLLFELQANRERHERTVKYVLADIYERYN